MEADKKLTGGRVNYYLVEITHPNREDQPPYRAECEDIIQALGMTFYEGTLLKSLFRSANMRTNGLGKVGADTHGIYDGEKIAHYGPLVLKERQLRREKCLAPERVLVRGDIGDGPVLGRREEDKL